MNDYYIEAVRTWQQANKDLKKFSQCCAMVDGRRTQALAQDCKVSVDTIENYRNAYILYQQIDIELETSEPVRIWDEANIALWVKAHHLKTRLKLSNEVIFDYLKTASEHNMTRESFAAHVDEKENDTPKWIRRIRHAIHVLFPSRNDWKTEMPIEKRTRYDEATARYVEELKEIAESE